MFEAFQTSPVENGRRRRWAAATVAAAILYGALGVFIAVYASSQKPPAEDKEVDVSFEKPAKKEEPPPAPLPATVTATPPPPPPPPPARPPRVAAVKPIKVAVPREVPKEAPPEADPATAPPSAGSGDENGAIGGTGPVGEPVPPPPPPPPPPKPEAINLPERATPPRASADNARPEYPERARASGHEGQVILKVVVTESGKVTRIQVLGGEEPFIAAALVAVRSWSYSPALLDGQPIAVYRILKIPFRLSAGYQEER